MRRDWRQSPRTAQMQDDQVEHRVGTERLLIGYHPWWKTRWWHHHISNISFCPAFQDACQACCCFGSTAEVFTLEKSVFCLSAISASMVALISSTANSMSHPAYSLLIQWLFADSMTFQRESRRMQVSRTSSRCCYHERNGQRQPYFSLH